MAEKIVSPGVFTQENDLSFVPQGVAEIGAAVIGPTVKGPANVPTIVNSFADYSAMFGTTFTSASMNYEYFTSLTAEEYLRNSGALTVVRVLSGSYGPASTSFGENNDGIPASGSVTLAADRFTQSFQLATLGDGEIENSSGSEGTNNLLAAGTKDNLRWEITSVNKQTGTFTLLIRRGDDTSNRKVILETWNNLSLDPNANNYISKMIGDQYYTVQDVTTADPFLQLTGDYKNRSKFVRVKAVTNTTPDYLDSNGHTSSNAYTASLPKEASGSFTGGSDGKQKDSKKNV